MIDLNFKYKKAISFIIKESPFTPDVALILGSGLGDFVNESEKIKSLNTSDIPDYPLSTVEGHKGIINFSRIKSKNILIFQGRLHFYEGLNLSDCLLPVLITKNLGCDKIILTNAAGGINRKFLPGDLMLIDSFNSINLKKEVTDLIGLASLEKRNVFIDCPSKEINDFFLESAIDINIPLQMGNYWYVKGPSYETPSEIEMIRKFGGDAVGMSTVHEAIFASSIKMKVAAISCITNMAAGISQQKLSHNEVMETAKKVSKKFSLLLKTAIPRL